MRRKHSFILSLIILGCLANIALSDAQCDTLTTDGYVFNIRPGETQIYNLYKFFQGYNLNFAIRDDEEMANQIQFLQNPQQKAVSTNNPIVKEGSEIVSYDAWQNEDGSVDHIVLVVDQNKQFTVYRGRSFTLIQLPDFVQVEGFDLTIDPGKVDYQCYQAFFVQKFIAVVDCLVNNIQAQEKYSQYFIINLEKDGLDSTTSQKVQNYQPALDVPENRINIVFNDENYGVFILSTIPLNQEERVKTTSEINIYSFQNLGVQTLPDGELISATEAPINSFAGETDPLFITDMGVSEEQIYILSFTQLFRFQFDGQQIIQLTRSKINLNDDDQNEIKKFAVYQDIDEQFIMMARNDQIQIFFWPQSDKDTDMELRAIIPINELVNISELKFGEDFAFIVSDGDIVAFNWYEAITSAAQNSEQIATINQVVLNYQSELDIYFEVFSKDYVFVISENKYGLYFFSDPILKIINPFDVKEREEFMIQAVSTETKNGNIDQRTCYISTFIQPLQDDDGTKLYPTSLNLNLDFIPSVVGKTQRKGLDGIYEGPNIQYKANYNQAKNSTAQLTTMNMLSFMPASIEISEAPQNIIFSKMWTIPTRNDAFYVFTQNSDYGVQADRCLIRESPDQVICLKRLYGIANYPDIIQDMAVDIYDQRTVIAVTYKNKKTTQVDFYYLNGTSYTSLKYDDKDQNNKVTDIEMMNGYVFVAQKGLRTINVYELDFKMKGDPIFKLNEETVGKWPCFGDAEHDWSHLAVYGHRSSPNMFYVETNMCLVEIQIIGSRPHFVSQYNLKTVKSRSSDRAVAVTEHSILVATVQVQQDNSIKQSIFEIYNDDPLQPLVLEPIPLYGLELTYPINAAFNYYSNSFYLLATKKVAKQDTYFIISVQSDEPDVSRLTVIYPLNILSQDTPSTNFLLKTAGQFDDYVTLIQPQTGFTQFMVNPSQNELIYSLDNQQLNFDFYTGFSYIDVSILGGIDTQNFTTKTVELVFQNPQSYLGANQNQITQDTQNPILVNQIGNKLIIDDSKWFYGSVLNCVISNYTSNSKGFTVRNHIELIDSTGVDDYTGSIDMITLNNTVIILTNDGSIIQLNSNLTQIKNFTLDQQLVGGRLPYQLVPMMKQNDKLIVLLRNREKIESDFALVFVSGVVGTEFKAESNAITFNGKYSEVFQVLVYNSSYVFVGWGSVARKSNEFGFISVYQITQVKDKPDRYMDFLRDLDDIEFKHPDLSISSFHLQDGISNNQAQLLFVLDDRGQYFDYVILNMTELSSTQGVLTPVPLDFQDVLRQNSLYYDSETLFFGLQQIGQSELDAESLAITFLLTTSNTGIYEMKFTFQYQTLLKPTVETKFIYNNYGPTFRVRRPAFVLGNNILVDFISGEVTTNRTDFLAIYDKTEVSKNLPGDIGLIKFKGSIIKGTNPNNIDLYVMIYDQESERVNLVYQDTNVVRGLIKNTLFAATYNQNITLLAYYDRFPDQKVSLQFNSFYSSPEVVTYTFAQPPDSTTSHSGHSDDQKKDNLEVLWILLGTFGGLLILAAAYILVQRKLLINRDQGEIAADEENYERLN